MNPAVSTGIKKPTSLSVFFVTPLGGAIAAEVQFKAAIFSLT
jgi:hypothetical protein